MFRGLGFRVLASRDSGPRGLGIKFLRVMD